MATLSSFLKTLGKAASKMDAKSTASAAKNMVRKNKVYVKPEKEQAAIAKIDAALNKKIDQIDARKETAMPKPKGNTPPKSKQRQSAKERQTAATGNVSNITTYQGNKKEGVGSMVSYTSKSRASGIKKAKDDLEAGLITQAEYDRIIKAIDRANAEEVNKSSRRASQQAADMSAKSPTMREAPFPIPGEAKRTKGLNYSRGGSVAGKSRTGHTDMRKGGLFK